MTSQDYILFLLTAFGIVYGIVGSSLLAPVRIGLATRSAWLAALIYCAYCIGFWVGITLRVFWPIDERVWVPFEFMEAGFLVVGSIALARAAWPTFLEGAYEHERHAFESGLRGSDVPEPEPEKDAEHDGR